MNAIMQMITSQLSGRAVGQISQQLGLSQDVVGRAVSAAIPLLMSALARNASTPNGANSLFNAVSNDHDGSILDDVMGFLGNADAGPGSGILKHVLGKDQPVIQNRLGQTTGLDSQTIGKVLEMAAPLVMGAVGRSTQQQGLDAEGLANFLNQQKQHAEETEPTVIGSISKLLDQDGDGNPLDDLGNVVGKLFGGF